MKIGIHIILPLATILLCACAKGHPGPDIPPDPPGSDTVTYTYRQARSTKRGVGFNTVYAADVEIMKNGVSWLYNWDSKYNSSLAVSMDNAGMDYIPMAWNGDFNADNIRAYKTQHPECLYILAFNEPNLTDQANMTPAQAASQWPALKNLAQELNMKIVAPAMNYGTLSGYGDPIVWLDEFFELVPLSDVDVIAIHCYMNVPSAVKWFVGRFRKYGKPIWMTEFCAWEGTDLTLDAQRRYMCDVVNYFETDPLIERYAWFMFDGAATQYPYYALKSGNALTGLGRIYVNLSSQDKNAWYAANEVIPAAHYSQCNQANVVGTETWAGSVMLNLSADKTGILDVTEFSTSKWLEYQIDVPAPGSYTLTLRYAAAAMSYGSVRLNNGVIATLIFPPTGGYTQWSAYTATVSLPAGRQTLRIAIDNGEIAMKWWKFNIL